MERLAKIACYSPFHFHRVFQAIVGETVHGYVKRLRMQTAAGKLRYTEQPVTAIALDASFETPSAFTKAFKQFMGSSPRDYRSLYAAMNTLTQKIKELPMIKPDKIRKIFTRLTSSFYREGMEIILYLQGLLGKLCIDLSRENPLGPFYGTVFWTFSR